FTLDPKTEGDPFRLQDALDRKAGAEKILRDMEQKVRSAKARKIVVDIEERDGDKVSRLSGYVILAEGDRARLEMVRTTGDRKETWKLVCDGKRVLGQGGPFDTEGKPEEIQKGLTDPLVQLISRYGVQAAFGPGVSSDEKFDIDRIAPMYNI